MYRFEKLRVYHDVMLLIKDIYTVIKKLPPEERFGLADQLRRSSVYIVLNIAEGTGGLGDTEFKSFLRNSLKSLYETVAGLEIAHMLYGVNIESQLKICDQVGKELNALINSLKTKD